MSATVEIGRLSSVDLGKWISITHHGAGYIFAISHHDSGFTEVELLEDMYTLPSTTLADITGKPTPKEAA